MVWARQHAELIAVFFVDDNMRELGLPRSQRLHRLHCNCLKLLEPAQEALYHSEHFEIPEEIFTSECLTHR